MKRCSIIIHSVSGNCFIIGHYLKELMAERNVDAALVLIEVALQQTFTADGDDFLHVGGQQALA